MPKKITLRLKTSTVNPVAFARVVRTLNMFRFKPPSKRMMMRARIPIYGTSVEIVPSTLTIFSIGPRSIPMNIKIITSGNLGSHEYLR
ncbi:hypothetical protein ig2599ANME_0147 [groundwater metagenome]